METARKRVHELQHEVAPKHGDFTKKPKKNWLLPTLFILVILLVSISFVRIFTPEVQPPVKENSWLGITPGYTFTQKVAEQLGEPLSVKTIRDKKEISYKSKFPSKPNTVLVSDKGIVVFVKEHVTYDATNVVENYYPQLGQPDFILYAPQISIGVKAHVFLTKGIVLIAHEADGSIEQKWYFEPTDKESFMFTWGTDLSESYSNQE